MFKLLFSLHGSITRSKFLLGMFDLVGLSIVFLIIWSFLYFSSMVGLSGTDFSKIMSTIKLPNNSASTTTAQPSEEEQRKQMDAEAKEFAKQMDQKLKTKQTQVNIVTAGGTIILGLFYLVTMWCKLCLFLKRLTDIGLSRWFAITPFLAGGLLIFSHAIWFSNACLGLILLFYLVMLFWPSRVNT